MFPLFIILQRQEHILPISLESDDFDEELLSAPKTLRELVERYKQKKISFNKQHETLDNEKENDSFIGTSIFDHLAVNVFIFYNGCNFSYYNVYSNKTYI